MNRGRRWLTALRESLMLSFRALTAWTPRQIFASAGSAIIVALVLGIATVLIPNDLFTREIAPVWWNYPVWLLTAAMTGILIGTYVRPRRAIDATPQADDSRTGRFAIAGGMLAWFAVGCPVCNKIALIALGYTGALTWFAPFQPVLAVAALIFSTVAVVWRLRGQVACPLPRSRKTVAA